MDELTKQRTAARGWLAREKLKLSDLFAEEAKPSIIELRYAIGNFETRLEKLEDNRFNLDLAAPEDILKQFQKRWFECREALTPTLLKAKAALEQLS